VSVPAKRVGVSVQGEYDGVSVQGKHGGVLVQRFDVTSQGKHLVYQCQANERVSLQDDRFLIVVCCRCEERSH
jgi:hypothetical protein